MKILLVEDHAIFREGLSRILSEEFEAAFFGEAGNATEALEKIWKGKWDVILLDIAMHGRTGLDVLKEIRRSGTLRLPTMKQWSDRSSTVSGILFWDDQVLERLRGRFLIAELEL